MASTMMQCVEQGAVGQVARHVAQVWVSGGLVVFHTETTYGVGVWARHDVGYAGLLALRGYDRPGPFAVHLSQPAEAGRYVDMDDPVLSRLIRKCMPGPVTLIVEVCEDMAAAKASAMGLTAQQAQRVYVDGAVTLRCPDDAVAQGLLAQAQGPIVACAVHRAGQRPAHDAQTAAALVGEAAACVVDGGHTRYTKPSTVLRIRRVSSRYTYELVRPGVYDERFVKKLMRQTILMVCTGNTCRSPMAEVIARHELAKQRGVSPEALADSGVEVLSAGVYASGGQAASEHAWLALRELGYEPGDHRSRPLTLDLVNQADVIYCMTRSHLEALLTMAPAARDKARLLDPSGDIDDPYGSDVATYQQCAMQIAQKLRERLEEDGL